VARSLLKFSSLTACRKEPETRIRPEPQAQHRTSSQIMVGRSIRSMMALLATAWGRWFESPTGSSRHFPEHSPQHLPVLEINPRHPLIRKLADGAAPDAALAETAGLLLDLARVQDGDIPRDPAGFARRVAAALAVGPR
jgi:HSP90 family molecular chaperone